jgi:hypothetical protein
MLEQDKIMNPTTRNGIQRNRKSSPVSGKFTLNTGTWDTFCRSKNISRFIASCIDLLLFKPRVINSWKLNLFSFHLLPFRTSLSSLLLVFIFFCCQIVRCWHFSQTLLGGQELPGDSPINFSSDELQCTDILWYLTYYDMKGYRKSRPLLVDSRINAYEEITDAMFCKYQ